MGDVASGYSDDEILKATKVELKDGRKQFKYTLPDGDDLSSEWMRPEDVKAKVLISWCEIVRATINDRHNQKMTAMNNKRLRRLQEEAKDAIAAGHAHVDASGNVIWHMPKAEAMALLGHAPTANSSSGSLVDQTGKPLTASDTEAKMLDTPTISSKMMPPDGQAQQVIDDSADSYVHNHLLRANSTVERLEAQGQEILAALRKAKQEQAKWLKLSIALDANMVNSEDK